MQNEHSTSSACILLHDELGNPVQAIALGICDENGDAALTHIKVSLYHECGHIVHGDLKPSFYELIHSLVAISPQIIGLCIGNKVFNSTSCTRLSYVKAAAAAILTAVILEKIRFKIILPCLDRKIEKDADLFAIRKLIELKDFESLACNFLDFTYHLEDGNFNDINERPLFHDHPGFFERAFFIVDELKKANLDIAQLPSITANLQAQVNEQLQKFNKLG